jgi:histone deacetylase HOS2
LQTLKKVPAPNPIQQARWAQRAVEESASHSFSNPFVPIQDDVDRWLWFAQETPRKLKNPQTFTQVPQGKNPHMRPSAMNGLSHDSIVQEYSSPEPPLFEHDYQTFKLLPDDAKRAVIQREAEEYGMEKPQGYSVSFHYNPHVEYHHFGSSHPMKPWRLTLTKQLVLSYGLEYCMELYEPRPATFEELAIFHDREYLSFLNKYVCYHTELGSYVSANRSTGLPHKMLNRTILHT